MLGFRFFLVYTYFIVENTNPGVGNLFTKKSQTNKTKMRHFSKEPEQSLHSCIRNICDFFYYIITIVVIYDLHW